MADMTILDDKAVAEIEARSNAATDGPWGPHKMAPLCGGAHQWFEVGPYPQQSVCEVTNDYPNFRANAEFIGHARIDIPALCQTVRALREERQELWFFLTRRPASQVSHAELIAIHKDMAAERCELKDQLAAVTQERDDARALVTRMTVEKQRLEQECNVLRTENEELRDDLEDAEKDLRAEFGDGIRKQL